MSEERVLVVEDEPDQRQLVASILRGAGYFVAEAGSLEEARRELDRAPFDVVVADGKLPDGNGIELLDDGPDGGADGGPAFVLVTAYGTIAHAVEAVRLGADDYLSKPFERQTLLLAIEKALRSHRLEHENRRLVEALAERDRLVGLVGSAATMQRLFRQVEKLASTSATVLVTGESGTGKELAARALHTLSPRAAGPFVAVNCAAVPEGLLEAEFFGVEKGAFTGADRTRAGQFEAAGGGTLFLDEIGELPLALQPKLLRTLQEGTFTRVGSTEERRADVRLIAATHRELAGEAAAGRFRQDLYYRLAVVPIEMPPLRDRREDIPLLVEHFKARAARRHGVRVAPFSKSLVKRLIDHPWPGNVRELGNAIERLVLLAEDGRASADDLPQEMSSPGAAGDGAFELPPGGISWDRHEQSCLAQALDLAGGNRAQAARLLGLPYKAFLYRLEKHGLDV